MTTPHNHVLVDYESVQPELASRLTPDFFKVWVFVKSLHSTTAKNAMQCEARYAYKSMETKP